MGVLPLLLSAAIPLLLAVFLKSVFDALVTTRHRQYAPGPKPKPLIGNLLDFQSSGDLGAEYMSWSKKYGSDLLFASALGNDLLIVNNQEDADELFDRRANIYSDRPQAPILGLLGWEGMVSLLPYGHYWRKCRKICQQHFNYESAKKYRPTILEKVHRLMGALLESPDKFSLHNKMLSVSITMATMYGYEVKSVDDPMIAAADEALALGASLLAPGSSVVNFLPFLGRIPARFSGPMTSLKAAAKTKMLSRFMQTSMSAYVRRAIDTGTAVSSLMTDYMEQYTDTKPLEEDERAMADVAWTTYSGAADTTISATSTLFYLMAKHPEVQKKAQSEIDQLLGSSRLPTFEDRPHLPYIEAMYREVMRYQQSLHLAAPHSTTDDDYYKGYFIPKGCMVFGNVWAMTHNEDKYPDPYSFKPERFFDKDGNLNDDDRILAYGFGRRICVGKAIASSILWAVIASVLSSFDIGKAKDENGQEIEVNDDYYTDGILTHKSPFKCSITPRSATCKDLITDKLNQRD